MKGHVTLIIAILTIFGNSASALDPHTPRANYPAFDRSKDILIAQHDSLPDPDDVHAQAALGCLLAHSDLAGVNVYAVLGATGIQSTANGFKDSSDLMTLIFGTQGPDTWTYAWDGGGASEGVNWNRSVDRIKTTVRNTLENGGRVWVQEAGQSNITADWIREMINDGVSESLIKTNVLVVQHSAWNDSKTTAADRDYVKAKATYVTIDDGNETNQTADFRPDPVVEEDKTYLIEAQSASNLNPIARAFWTKAVAVIEREGDAGAGAHIPFGSVDFSDCCENIWIFDIQNCDTVRQFWDRYVVNNPGNTVPIIDPSPLPNAMVNSGYSATLVPIGGEAPFSWSVVSGSLPNGLSLSTNGTISGTPTTEGACDFTVQVVDVDGDSNQSGMTIDVSPDISGIYHLGSNGVVVIDAEFSAPGTGWEEKTSLSGYTGTSYYEATVNQFGTPGYGKILEYPFQVAHPGAYQFQMRTYIAAGSDNSECNDVWVTLVDVNGNKVNPANIGELNPIEGWHKVYMKLLNGWDWMAGTVDDHPKALYWNLQAGKTYRVQLSARSAGHAVDRIALWDRSGTQYANTADGTVTSGNRASLDALPVSQLFSGGGVNDQEPYSGTPAQVPGLIEAEDYDIGGQGIAYYDSTTGNSHGADRSDDVDIDNCTDTGGGFNIGAIAAGEWLEYTVDVAISNLYGVEFRVASPASGGTLHLEVNGQDLTGPVAFNATGEWQSWTTIAVSHIPLQQGEQIIRLVFDSAGFNLNWFEFVVQQDPYTGTAWPVPGKIQAEDYDTGGQGVAYFDGTSGNSKGQYRSDDVDIEITTDTGGGFDVSAIQPGEWLEYTVNVAAAGSYTVDFRVAATQSGKTFHLENADGTNLTGAIALPKTGGWQIWTNVTSSAIQLQQGKQVVRIVFDTDRYNLNWMKILPTAPTAYVIWENKYNIEQSEPSDDSDGDGFSNAYEYYFGLNPTNSINERQPATVASGGELGFVYTYRTDGPITYAVESSSDMVNWSPDASMIEIVSSDNGDGTSTREIRTAIDAVSDPARFFRIKAQ